MKYLHLILINLFRKKIRITLTVGSFAVALFLFGLLFTIHGAFYQGIEVAGADRLVILNRVSLTQPLPISYRERLAQTPNVRNVAFACWFGGIYQEERNFFPQFAIEPESYHRMYPELLIPEDQWRSFLADREGAVVGAHTADRFGWKIGDRIPLKGTIFPGVWEFNIRAIYEGKRQSDDTSQFWFQYKFLEERAPAFFHGLVGWYVVRVNSPDAAVATVKAIDERFANSAYETKTDTEKGFASAFLKQMGNIQLLILTIGAVVFFTLLLVTGNTMAIAVRERTAELAVMKTVGFSNLKVLGLVLVESAIIALVGGGLGLALAKLFLRNDPTGGLLPTFSLPDKAIGEGILLSLVVGLIAGALPAISAMRLRVVDALRRI